MNDLDNSAALTERARDLAANVVTTSRRGLLCGAVGASAAAVLAACGSGDSAGGGDDKDKDGKSKDDSAGGDALAKESDIPEGGGKVVDDLVIVQPEKGTFKAFSTTCPHKQFPNVGAPKDGVLTCSKHGSQFNIDGSVAKGPATSGLKEVKITVENGEILRA